MLFCVALHIRSGYHKGKSVVEFGVESGGPFREVPCFPWFKFVVGGGVSLFSCI